MEKIDWSKERTLDRNFCGYCFNTASTSSCDGLCFTSKDIDPVTIKQNKIIHFIDLIKQIKKDRKALNKREMYLSKELFRLKNSNPLP